MSYVSKIVVMSQFKLIHLINISIDSPCPPLIESSSAIPDLHTPNNFKMILASDASNRGSMMSPIHSNPVRELVIFLDCRGEFSAIDVEHSILFVPEVGESTQELPFHLVVG